MKILKYLSFIFATVIVLLLASATIIEKVTGMTSIYTSPLMISLWCVLVVTSIAYIVRKKMYKKVAVFGLHISFVVILAGAFVTWNSSESGCIKIAFDEYVSSFINESDEKIDMPFGIRLNDFEIKTYPGTSNPMDFVSNFTINDDGNETTGIVSMNNIFDYKGYRFYQMGYNSDNSGVILSVSYDPYGIAITYTGYILLLLSIIIFFFDRGTGFRKALSKVSIKALPLLLLLIIPKGLNAAQGHDPKTVPSNIANNFGELCIYHNDRIAPVETFAIDLVNKLYGSSSYGKFSPVQVVLGWIFFYSDWADEPIVKIKDSGVRELLGTTEKYVSYNDFFNRYNEYKLQPLMEKIRRGERVENSGAIIECNENFEIIGMLARGNLLKIYPVNINGRISWYAPADNLPVEMDNEKWIFVRKSLGVMNEMLRKKKYDEVDKFIDKLTKYQQKECDEALPSVHRLKVEHYYNCISDTKMLAMINLFVGIVAFLLLVFDKLKGGSSRLFFGWTLVMAIYLCVFIILRGYISGHFPVSNGFETMVFMSFVSLVLSLLFNRKFPILIPLGIMVAGLSLMVASFSSGNPSITSLMPVLSSPLMSIHVAVIMISYTLFAFMMLNGMVALIHSKRSGNYNEQVQHLTNLNRVMLYPALFLLAIGIFIGAVWANISWGRYWGWDPKEVWALITMLIYSFGFHSESLPLFRSHRFFNWYCVLSFVSVIITYFGVNFILGGLHSYA